MVGIKGIGNVLKKSGAGFIRDRIPKLSASLAYYTIFSLGPMLMVIIFLSNLFWEKQAIEGLIFEHTKSFVGSKAAFQIQEIIKNASLDNDNTLTAVIGFIALFIGATTVFADIQDSINTIWKLKVKPGRGFFILLKTRLLSFSLVASLSFLLLVSLVLNSFIDGFINPLQEHFPKITIIIVYIANVLITLLITSFLFLIIFKVLPDAIIRWKDVIAGSVFTALLFLIGRFGLSFYITSSNLGSAHGAAGSLVILVLWVYFSAIVLYFGAEFTKFFALQFGGEIRPDKYAVVTQIIQVETINNIKESEENASKTEEELQKAKDKLDKQNLNDTPEQN